MLWFYVHLFIAGTLYAAILGPITKTLVKELFDDLLGQPWLNKTLNKCVFEGATLFAFF